MISTEKRENVIGSEKECEICGKFFVITTWNRKYCDDCSPNSDKAKLKQEKALKDSIHRLYEPKILTITCFECGREHKTTRKLLVTGEKYEENGEEITPTFCCFQHRDLWEKKREKCACCGKPLYGNEYYINSQGQISHKYCSAECEDEYARKTHKCECCGRPLTETDYCHADKPDTLWYCSDKCRHDGWEERALKGEKGYYICQWCGKPYKRSQPGTFCSRKCYSESVAAKKHADILHTQKQGIMTDLTQKRIKVRTNCAICNKGFVVEVPVPYDGLGVFTCSDDCKKELYRLKVLQKKRERQKLVELKAEQLAKEKFETMKAAEKRKKKKEAEENTPLCASCKVSYADCERMQSNFRIIPKGAHYNSRGILRECPKYRG